LGVGGPATVGGSLARDVAWRGEVTAGAAEVEGEGEGEVGTGRGRGRGRGRRPRRGGRSREWALLLGAVRWAGGLTFALVRRCLPVASGGPASTVSRGLVSCVPRMGMGMEMGMGDGPKASSCRGDGEDR